jgi:hypothetical protein
LISFVSALSTIESKTPSKINSSNIQDKGISSSNTVEIIPSPNNSPKLEKYIIYAAQPTNSKSGTGLGL